MGNFLKNTSEKFLPQDFITKGKFILRKKVLEYRNGQIKKEIKEKSSLIKKNFFSSTLYQKAKTIMFYVSFGSEVETKEMIKETLKQKKRVVVPKVIMKEKRLLPSELKNFKELKKGAYGILEPKDEYIREIKTSELDLVIVPGIVFDENGYRIGYGGGFYDRFLKGLNKKTKKIALSFVLQIVDNLPKNKDDQRVNWIITEEGIIKCPN